jgi:hypothetical protein
MTEHTILLRDVLRKGIDIGLKDYPIFDESYREGLNQKIVNHFLMREIAHETIELFVNRLNTKMREIMPYYNQLFVAIKAGEGIDPFTTYDTFSESSTKADGDSTATNEATSKSDGKGSSTSVSRTRASDHPYDYDANPNGLYATGVNDGETSGATNSSDSSASRSGSVSRETRSGESKSRAKGRTQSYSEIASGLLTSYFNIDMMIISELDVLFYGLDTQLDWLFPQHTWNIPFNMFNPFRGWW